MSFELDKSKLGDLAKKSHNRCHGTGIAHYRPGTNEATVCRCVWRKLVAQGINLKDPEAVKKAIGRDAPAAAVVPKPDVVTAS